MPYKKIERVEVRSDWFLRAIKYAGGSARKLNMKGEHPVSERTIRRAKENGIIRLDVLNSIAKELDIDPYYLTGALPEVKLILEECDDMRIQDFIFRNYLNKQAFPYKSERKRKKELAKGGYIASILLAHAVSTARLNDLTEYEKRLFYEKLQEIDNLTTEMLKRFFPECIGANFAAYNLIYRWQTIEDVYDSILVPLQKAGLTNRDNHL